MRNMIIAVTILVPAASSAGGYLIPSTSAREVGTSQAGVADQSGAEAVFLNTAALAGQDGLNVSVGGEYLSNRTTWSAPGGAVDASLIPQTNTPVGLAIAYGAKLDNGMAWGAGIGFGVPAGGSLVWPNGWPGQESIQSVKQMVFGFGGGVGFKPTPYLKLGASYVRFQATEELHQSLNFLDHFGDAGLAMSGGANSFGLAAEFRVPTVPLSLAATYVHKAEINLEGHAHFTGVPPAFQPLLHDQDVTEKLIIPNVVFIGAAYEAMPNLKVMTAYSWENWSLYKSDVFIGEGEGDDRFTVTVPRNYNDAHVIRFGGEWAKLPVLPMMTARAGFQRSISDQPSETLSPSLTDASSWGVSLGAGLDVKPGLRVDVGYQHVFFDKVTASGAEAFPGSYETAVDILSIGVNWRTDLNFAKAK